MKYSLLPVLVSLMACNGDEFVASPTDDAGNPIDAHVNDVSLSDSPITPPPDSGIVDANVPDAAQAPVDCTKMLAGTIVCSDFENVMNPQKGWTSPLSLQGTNILDNSTFVSPSHSYQAQVLTANQPLATFAMLLAEDNSGLYKTFVTRANLRVHTVDATDLIPVISFTYTTASIAEVGVDVAVVGNHLALVILQPGSDGGLVSTPTDLGVYAVDTWMSVRLEVSPTTSQVNMFINDKKAILPNTSLQAPSDNTRRLRIGVVFASNRKGDNTVNFDDVLFRGL